MTSKLVCPDPVCQVSRIVLHELTHFVAKESRNYDAAFEAWVVVVCAQNTTMDIIAYRLPHHLFVLFLFLLLCAWLTEVSYGNRLRKQSKGRCRSLICLL